jgi:putative membrane protein (TIGR04086 family)
MATRTQTAENQGAIRAVKPVAVSVLVGAAVSALLLLGMAYILSSRTVPQFAVDPMASVSLAGGGLASGLCCARIMRRKGLLYGAVCGALLTVIVLIVGLILDDGGFGVPTLFKALVLLLPAMLGGVLGVNARRR